VLLRLHMLRLLVPLHAAALVAQAELVLWKQVRGAKPGCKEWARSVAQCQEGTTAEGLLEGPLAITCHLMVLTHRTRPQPGQPQEAQHP